MMKIAFSAKSYLERLDDNFVIPMPAKPDTYVPGSRKNAFDDLMMYATLFDDGKKRCFFLTLEISFVRPLLVDRIFKAIQQEDGTFRRENLFVIASHTHIGPVYSKDQYASNHNYGPVEAEGELFGELVDHWCLLAAGMYAECAGRLTAFRADIAAPELYRCFSSREGLDAPCDKRATVIRFFEAGSEKPLGLWLHLAGHSMFHPEFTLLGCDLIGTVSRKLAAGYGACVQPFAGCQLNTSTKLTGRRTFGIQDSIDECRRVADEIVSQIREKAEFETIHISSLDIRKLTLKYCENVDRTAIKREITAESLTLQSDPGNERLASHIRMLEQRAGLADNCGLFEAWVAALGELKLLMINGELPNSIGPELSLHEPHRHCVPICYTNGLADYNLAESGYTAWSAPAGLAAVMVGLLHNELR
jgi:hypothetical protein